jgi:hypothetical protein
MPATSEPDDFVMSGLLQLRSWSPIWVDRTEFCFSSVAGTLRDFVLGGGKHVVNQWLAADGVQIRMLLKMICKFKDLPPTGLGAMG